MYLLLILIILFQNAHQNIQQETQFLFVDIMKRYGFRNIVALSTIIEEPGYDNVRWPRGKHSCSYYVAQMLVIRQRAMNSEHVKILIIIFRLHFGHYRLTFQSHHKLGFH